MASTTFSKDVLRSFLKKQKISTLDGLKQALGTSATMTVFRKLDDLGYLTSYSHNGKYYTLNEIPDFDDQGLWSCRSVRFCKHGNLLRTTRYFVLQAQTGYTAGELQCLLHVQVKRPLLKLYRQKQLYRERIGNVYVYLAWEKGRRTQQRLLREDRQAPSETGVSSEGRILAEELKAAIVLFYSLLDEKRRRLYAGLESYKLGHGGDRKIAECLGLDVHTVARGRRELFGGQVDRERVRGLGGGRKLTEKKRRKSSTRSSN